MALTASNTPLTIGMITREALMVLENQLTFTKFVNRNYDDQFAVPGAKIGATINIRQPNRFVTRDPTNVAIGNSGTIQGTTDSALPLTLNKQYGVDVSFSSQELTLSIDEFRERILVPAMTEIANQIDYDGLQLLAQVYNQVGTPGTAITTLAPFLNAGALLDLNATPKDASGKMRSIVIDPVTQASFLGASSGVLTLFNPQAVISDMYQTGNIGSSLGFKWSMDQNSPSLTSGTIVPGTDTITVNSNTGFSNTAASGFQNVVPTTCTMTVTNASGHRMAVGDVFTAGDGTNAGDVYMASPKAQASGSTGRKSTGQLQEFVVITATSDTSYVIAPAVITSGAYQNCAITTPGASVKIVVKSPASTTYPLGVAFHKDAFVFGTADLQMPNGVDMSDRVASSDLGISMRIVRAYDINTDYFPCRIDILGGWAPLYRQWAVRIAGKSNALY